MAKTAREEAQKIIADNRKAHHDYHLIETFEAGVALLGTEVKAIREGGVQLRDSFARIEGGEVWIYNVHISAYSNRGYSSHEPTRKRKLLLHRQEIKKLIGKTVEKGMTLVPVRMYLKNGRDQGGDQPGEGQEGPRQARDHQAAGNGSGNARGGEGKTVDYSPYEDESRGPDRGRHCRARGCRLVHVPPRQRRADRSPRAVRPGRRKTAPVPTPSSTPRSRARRRRRSWRRPTAASHFKIRVPEDGWLKVSLGMKPESWDKEGNGVYFFAGVSDGRAFEQLFEQTLNPFKNPSERRWIPVTVDLSAYAGEEMDVILNTRSQRRPAAARRSQRPSPLGRARKSFAA